MLSSWLQFLLMLFKYWGLSQKTPFPNKQTNNPPNPKLNQFKFLQNIWKRWNCISFHMAVKFSASLAENSVVLTTEWPQIKQILSWQYDHRILYLNWSSSPYYQEQSPNCQAQPLLSFLLYELCKSMQNIHKSQTCQGGPHFFVHFLPNGLLSSLESMFSVHPFFKANSNLYYITADSLFRYQRLCSV